MPTFKGKKVEKCPRGYVEDRKTKKCVPIKNFRLGGGGGGGSGLISAGGGGRIPITPIEPITPVNPDGPTGGGGGSDNSLPFKVIGTSVAVLVGVAALNEVMKRYGNLPDTPQYRQLATDEANAVIEDTQIGAAEKGKARGVVEDVFEFEMVDVTKYPRSKFDVGLRQRKGTPLSRFDKTGGDVNPPPPRRVETQPKATQPKPKQPDIFRQDMVNADNFPQLAKLQAQIEKGEPVPSLDKVPDLKDLKNNFKNIGERVKAATGNVSDKDLEQINKDLDIKDTAKKVLDKKTTTDSVPATGDSFFDQYLNPNNLNPNFNNPDIVYDAQVGDGDDVTTGLLDKDKAKADDVIKGGGDDETTGLLDKTKADDVIEGGGAPADTIDDADLDIKKPNLDAGKGNLNAGDLEFETGELPYENVIGDAAAIKNFEGMGDIPLKTIAEQEMGEISLSDAFIDTVMFLPDEAGAQLGALLTYSSGLATSSAEFMADALAGELTWAAMSSTMAAGIGNVLMDMAFAGLDALPFAAAIFTGEMIYDYVTGRNTTGLNPHMNYVSLNPRNTFNKIMKSLGIPLELLGVGQGRTVEASNYFMYDGEIYPMSELKGQLLPRIAENQQLKDNLWGAANGMWKASSMYYDYYGFGLEDGLKSFQELVLTNQPFRKAVISHISNELLNVHNKYIKFQQKYNMEHPDKPSFATQSEFIKNEIKKRTGYTTLRTNIMSGGTGALASTLAPNPNKVNNLLNVMYHMDETVYNELGIARDHPYFKPAELILEGYLDQVGANAKTPDYDTLSKREQAIVGQQIPSISSSLSPPPATPISEDAYSKIEPGRNDGLTDVQVGTSEYSDTYGQTATPISESAYSKIEPNAPPTSTAISNPRETPQTVGQYA